MRYGFGAFAVGLAVLPLSPSLAQTTPANTMDAMSAELRRARAEIESQRRALEAQETRLRRLETQIENSVRAPAPVSGDVAADRDVRTGSAGDRQARVDQDAVEQVGEGPSEIALPDVAVLGDMGSVVTRAGQTTFETTFEYARADRNRFLFRGIGAAEVVLIGQFDINESRQDILTATAGLRYGITDRFEFGVRVPFVHRADGSIITPLLGSGELGEREDASAKGDGVGDFEVSARYQLLSARGGRPFVIANLQALIPTGESGFEVPRTDLGVALKSATGSGFWSLSPSITAILPSDPAVLFGTLGYTYSFAENLNTRLGDVIIERAEPGQALSGSLGIGVSLNQRTSFNLGYAHSWVFGTKTTLRDRLDAPGVDLRTQTSRDLQLGRFLFGVTYRLTDRANLNWSVEVGATEDATDLRTVLRIPIVL